MLMHQNRRLEMFGSSLRNAERILDKIRHTHRRHISEEEEEELPSYNQHNNHNDPQVQNQQNCPNSENTFEVEDDEDRRLQESEVAGQSSRREFSAEQHTGRTVNQSDRLFHANKPLVPRSMSAADILERQFLKQTIKEYLEHLSILQNNQENLLLTIQKMGEKLNYIRDYEDLMAKIQKRNSILDQEIKELEEEEAQLDRMIRRQQFTGMKLVEDTKKNVRKLLMATSVSENDLYDSFERKWHSYLEQLKKPVPVATKEMEKKLQQKVKNLIQSMTGPPGNSTVVSVVSPVIQEPKLQKKVSKRPNDDLLGNLKQFSKNLKLPIDKLKK